LSAQLGSLYEPEQSDHVERAGRYDAGVGQLGPGRAGAVGGQLDAVAVGVGQADGLGDPVVGRAGDRRIGGSKASRGPRELEP